MKEDEGEEEKEGSTSMAGVCEWVATAAKLEKIRDFVGGKDGDGKLKEGGSLGKRGEKGGGSKQRVQGRCLRLGRVLTFAH